jgi:hypothetical protein
MTDHYNISSTYNALLSKLLILRWFWNCCMLQPQIKSTGIITRCVMHNKLSNYKVNNAQTPKLLLLSSAWAKCVSLSRSQSPLANTNTLQHRRHNSLRCLSLLISGACSYRMPNKLLRTKAFDWVRPRVHAKEWVRSQHCVPTSKFTHINIYHIVCARITKCAPVERLKGKRHTSWLSQVEQWVIAADNTARDSRSSGVCTWLGVGNIRRYFFLV